jgi:hypothetical protein
MEIRIERFARERQAFRTSTGYELPSTTYRNYEFFGLTILWAIERVVE